MDKLTQVTTPATTISYSYDALGRRISRTAGSSTANYMLDGNSDLTDYEIDGNGKLTGAYLRGADGLISQTDYTGQSPITAGYLYNPHGDTSATTDQNGNVTGTYRYDSFGNPTGTNNLADAYTGKWQRNTDDATGLIKMGAREYDPALGRFVSADSLQGDPFDPQRRNRYAYATNNPLSKYDLTGLETTETISAGQITYTSTDLDGDPNSSLSMPDYHPSQTDTTLADIGDYSTKELPDQSTDNLRNL